MSLIVIPIPTPATLFVAKQVRAVLPAGVIQFSDGSEELFLVTPTGQTFVPTAAGNVVPNPGDWILVSRLTFNQATGTGYSGPGWGTIVAPNPNGPFLVVPNATFNATYAESYGQGTPPNQGIVP